MSRDYVAEPALDIYQILMRFTPCDLPKSQFQKICMNPHRLVGMSFEYKYWLKLPI